MEVLKIHETAIMIQVNDLMINYLPPFFKGLLGVVIEIIVAPQFKQPQVRLLSTQTLFSFFFLDAIVECL